MHSLTQSDQFFPDSWTNFGKEI